MPLLRIWNSIRGRSTPKETPRQESSANSSTPDVSNSPGRRPIKSSRLSLFGGGGPHGDLLKLVKPLNARWVLEICVGDGSRAIAIVQTLGSPPPVRYLAIDQFEMVGGEVTLKAFHQRLRSAGIRGQVFPEPIDRGLVRVANTVGAVDLIVIAAAPEDWQTPETLSLLARVAHPNTVVLYQDDESWDRFEVPDPVQQRRQAA